MDVVLLLAALPPLAVGMIGLYAPFFKGKRELEELEKKYGKAKAKIERFEVRFDEQKKKIDKFSRQLDSNKKEIDELKIRNRRYKDETKKVTRAGREFLDRKQTLTADADSKEAALKEVQAELLDVRQKNATLAGEVRDHKERCTGLERELETARAAAQKAPAEKAPPPPPREQPPRDVEAPPDEGLQKRVRELQKSLKARETELKVLRRKQEHNRRAYLVTMMQLDLAQDELYMLKTGKPRRDTQKARRQVPEGEPATEDQPAPIVSDEEPEPETVSELLDEVEPNAATEDNQAPTAPEGTPATEDNQAPTAPEGTPATEDNQAPTVTEGEPVKTEES